MRAAASTGQLLRARDYLLLAALPQLLSIGIATALGNQLALVNIDHLVLTAACIVLARWSRTAAIWLLAIGIVLIAATLPMLNAGITYIGGFDGLAAYMAFWTKWPWKLLFSIALACIALIAILAQFINRTSLRTLHAWPFLFLAGLATATDIVSGSNSHANTSDIIPLNVATSSGAAILAALGSVSEAEDTFKEPVGERAMSFLFAPTSEPPPDKILSIAVESWGLFRDQTLNEIIARSMTEQLGDKYRIRPIRIPFRGATLSAEFRQLCGISMQNPPRLNDVVAHGTECLPQYFRNRGYFTWAGHANAGAFYDRSRIYPAMGFEQTAFLEDIANSSGARAACQSKTWFEASCDDEIVMLAMKAMGAHRRVFAHVMTLDTHLPIRSHASCPSGYKPPKPLPKAICAYLSVFSLSLGQIGTRIEMAKDAPDIIVIFGDHAPPFMDPVLHAMFDQHHAPALILQRRGTTR